MGDVGMGRGDVLLCWMRRQELGGCSEKLCMVKKKAEGGGMERDILLDWSPGCKRWRVCMVMWQRTSSDLEYWFTPAQFVCM